MIIFFLLFLISQCFSLPMMDTNTFTELQDNNLIGFSVGPSRIANEVEERIKREITIPNSPTVALFIASYIFVSDVMNNYSPELTGDISTSISYIATNTKINSIQIPIVSPFELQFIEPNITIYSYMTKIDNKHTSYFVTDIKCTTISGLCLNIIDTTDNTTQATTQGLFAIVRFDDDGNLVWSLRWDINSDTRFTFRDSIQIPGVSFYFTYLVSALGSIIQDVINFVDNTLNNLSEILDSNSSLSISYCDNSSNSSESSSIETEDLSSVFSSNNVDTYLNYDYHGIGMESSDYYLDSTGESFISDELQKVNLSSLCNTSNHDYQDDYVDSLDYYDYHIQSVSSDEIKDSMNLSPIFYSSEVSFTNYDESFIDFDSDEFESYDSSSSESNQYD